MLHLPHKRCTIWTHIYVQATSHPEVFAPCVPGTGACPVNYVCSMPVLPCPMTSGSSMYIRTWAYDLNGDGERWFSRVARSSIRYIKLEILN